MSQKAFRLFLAPILCIFAVCANRLVISVAKYSIISWGDVSALFILILMGILGFGVFRKIKPNDEEVWDYKYPIMSLEVVSLIVRVFLMVFVATAIYMGIVEITRIFSSFLESILFAK